MKEDAKRDHSPWNFGLESGFLQLAQHIIYSINIYIYASMNRLKSTKAFECVTLVSWENFPFSCLFSKMSMSFDRNA